MNVSNEKNALNQSDRDRRLYAVGRLSLCREKGDLAFLPATADVNSHIHTTYSFSPYTPAMAVLKSVEAGLATCGIMDHDSVAGVEEFHLAGEALGIKTTAGCEIRASFDGTFLAATRINNPDQRGVAYLAMHGIPRRSLPAVRHFLEPVRQARKRRNKMMADTIAGLLKPHGIDNAYEDAEALSNFAEGGSVTERHLIFAVVKKLVALADRTKQPLSETTAAVFGIRPDDKAVRRIDDPANLHREYDLLGVLKSRLVEQFYLDATDECPPVRDVAAFCREHGIILAYPYLGDISESVTGDKKAQTFEDSYLEALLDLLAELGIEAITFMPSRNTPEQLDRLMALAEARHLFQISGEDINQPRQSFVCEAMRSDTFDHLRIAAHALIGHEREANIDLERGFFSGMTKTAYPDLHDRMEHFARLSEQGGHT